MGPRRLTGLAALIAAVLVLPAPATAALPPEPISVISSFGRLIDPIGALSELEFFPITGAMTPDGRFVWTIGTRSRTDHVDIQITNAATGEIVQQLNTPGADRGKLRGIVISHDGRRAYASDARDQIDVFDINPATGQAQLAANPVIPVPPPDDAQPYDDFPPGPNTASYPEGLALTPDDRTLVVALNLSERAAVIDTQTRAVEQVLVRSDGKPGDRAYPANVAIAGGRAFVTNEGDGSVSTFELSNPQGVERVMPQFEDPSGVNPKRTHPNGIVAAPDGKHVFVSLSGDDQVLELDAADPSTVTRRFDVRRVTGGLGTQPVGMAVSPDDGTLFVADTGEDVVRVIALKRREVTLPGGVGNLPRPIRNRVRVRETRHLCHRKPRRGKKARAARVSGKRRRPCARRHYQRGKRLKAAASRKVVTVRSGDELGRIPSGIYPRQVLLSKNSRRLAIVNAKGVGPGSTFEAGENVVAALRGALQRISLPAGAAARDTAIVKAGARGASVPVPKDSRPVGPPGSPLIGPNGGASQKIKYVFYIVTENKTFDIMLGDLGRGDGDPCLAIFGERRIKRTHPDGSPCPYERFGVNDDGDRAGLNPGQKIDNTPITPNEHMLARQFVTLDNTYSNAETSDDGHIWTSGAYAPEYDVRATLESPHPFDLVYPVSAPPKGFIFDSMVRQGVSFFNYGEAAAGLAFPDTQANSDEQSVRDRVIANSEYVTQYPSSAAIDKDPITQRETLDHDPCEDLGLPPGTPCPEVNPATEVSRMQFFHKRFTEQIASCQGPAAANPDVCQVPQFNELLMPNNHGAGTGAGTRTPDALVRDTDQAIGQLVDRVSHSPIWPHTAIFVVQDDAQDGADHVEGHRITTLLASPHAKRGAVVSTHYDQVSVLRTIELILGMSPVYMYDALARPMWEAFTSTPDNRAFTRFKIPAALMDERNVAQAPMAKQSADYRWVADAVPESFINRLTWAYRYGTPRACPSRVGLVPYDPCHDPEGADEPEEDAERGKAILKALRKIHDEKRQGRRRGPRP